MNRNERIKAAVLAALEAGGEKTVPGTLAAVRLDPHLSRGDLRRLDDVDAADYIERKLWDLYESGYAARSAFIKGELVRFRAAPERRTEVVS